MNPEIPGRAPEVWTRQSFNFTDEVVDAYEGGSYGVPQDMVPDIAKAILDTLDHLGINPHDVYLSGHDGQEPDPDDAKLRGPEEARLYDEYVFPITTGDENDVDPDYSELADIDARAASDAREDAILAALDEPQKPEYAMSDVSTLLNTADAHNNPIHYAGISTESTIVVYDKAIIHRLDPGVPGEASGHVFLIEATEAELAVAALACIRLRYIIEGETDESPEPIPNN